LLQGQTCAKGQHWNWFAFHSPFFCRHVGIAQDDWVKNHLHTINERMTDDEDWDVMDAREESSDESGEDYDIMDDASKDLVHLGVAVVNSFDTVSSRYWNSQLFKAMDRFPEYKERGTEVQRVLGGFGALGNPSSFHDEDVRLFRRMRKKNIFRPVMAAYVKLLFKGVPHKNINIEALFDRLCVRCEAFNRPVAESWHRDIYGAEKYKLRQLPHSLPGDKQDLLFGGWTNLDHRDQKFVCLFSTHNEDIKGQKGFAEFSKQEIVTYKFNERLLKQAQRAYGLTIHTDEKGYVIIPPGHTIIFQQQLIHSVVSGPQPDTPALRVFHGLRLTTETAPLFDVSSAIENGGVPRIPSGQIPPMFSANHYQFFASHERYQKWAERVFRRECLFERVTKTGTIYYTPGSNGNRNRAANTGRHMPSLSEMGLWDERFEYSEREKRAMCPQRLFRE
jgi:hypothetical protein